MGDWRLDQNDHWVYDGNAPSAGDPTATRMMPAVSTEGAPVDVPPRVDDWCEDRPPGEITDFHGRE